jgi:hypothetical protein
MMKTLRDTLKNLREQYAIERADDPDSILRSFKHVFISRFDGNRFDDLISEITIKRNKITLHVTHPVVIQEIEGFKQRLIDAVNDDLGKSLLKDIKFEIVPE